MLSQLLRVYFLLLSRVCNSHAELEHTFFFGWLGTLLLERGEWVILCRWQVGPIVTYNIEIWRIRGSIWTEIRCISSLKVRWISYSFHANSVCHQDQILSTSLLGHGVCFLLSSVELKTQFLCCRGGLWNSGGQCHKESEPIFNQKYLGKYSSKMKVLEHVLRGMKTPVTYLNISRLTAYRKDAHPSIYRMVYKTDEERLAAERAQDCSHWCLPGVPDTWNELLYASILQSRRESWNSSCTYSLCDVLCRTLEKILGFVPTVMSLFRRMFDGFVFQGVIIQYSSSNAFVNMPSYWEERISVTKTFCSMNVFFHWECSFWFYREVEMVLQFTEFPQSWRETEERGREFSCPVENRFL